MPHLIGGVAISRPAAERRVPPMAGRAVRTGSGRDGEPPPRPGWRWPSRTAPLQKRPGRREGARGLGGSPDGGRFTGIKALRAPCRPPPRWRAGVPRTSGLKKGSSGILPGPRPARPGRGRRAHGLPRTASERLTSDMTPYASHLSPGKNSAPLIQRAPPRS
jgi:hypothetical protein